MIGHKRSSSREWVNPALDIQAYQLPDDSIMPNNATLRLLIYRHCLRLPDTGREEAIEELLQGNNWGDSWRNGIYPYHHYHSTAHEVLAVCQGTAEVQFGGPRGVAETVHPGDVIIIPAGVAHKNLGSSGDFLVIGAYPDGQKWDLCRGQPGERPQADENIRRVDLPSRDPIYGAEGPLRQYWHPA